MITNTLLVVEAAKLRPPEGAFKSSREMTCTCCGAPHTKGASVVTVRFPDSFTQYEDLANPHEQHACASCASLMAAENQMTTARSRFFACAKGLYRLSSLNDIAWYLLAELPRPYVAAINTSASMHVAWCTPMTNVEHDVDRIRLGHLVFAIDRPQAARTATVIAQLTAMLNDIENAHYKSVLEGISVYNKNAVGAHIPPKMRERIKQINHKPLTAKLLDVDNGLTLPGNAWAAGVLTLYRLQHDTLSIAIPKHPPRLT